MNEFTIHLEDNSEEFLKELEDKKDLILEALGIQVEAYAKMLTPVGDTGRLRSSITHAVKGDEVYIGTNVSYAPYVELGTGIYASDGKGRKSPWAFQDSKGKWHWTRGIKPHHMLKRAASEHDSEYKTIIENILKG